PADAAPAVDAARPGRGRGRAAPVPQRGPLFRLSYEERRAPGQRGRNSVPEAQARGAQGVPAYLRAATPSRSKFKTFEPGPTSRIRLLRVLYCSGITDTSSSTSSDGMVGFRTFLGNVRELRISTRYLPGRKPRLISYFPSLL